MPADIATIEKKPAPKRPEEEKKKLEKYTAPMTKLLLGATFDSGIWIPSCALGTSTGAGLGVKKNGHERRILPSCPKLACYRVGS